MSQKRGTRETSSSQTGLPATPVRVLTHTKERIQVQYIGMGMYVMLLVGLAVLLPQDLAGAAHWTATNSRGFRCAE